MVADFASSCRKIALALINRVRGRGLTSFARTIATFVNGAASLMLAAHSCPTSGRPFDSSGYVIAQFLRSPPCSVDPHHLQFAGRDLSSKFVVTSCYGQPRS